MLAFLRKLNPFAGLPNPKEVWAWGMYDLANQSFTLLITTVFFAIYFTDRVAATPARGNVLWGVCSGVTSLIMILAGPLLGAVADFGGHKKTFLTVTGVLCGVLTCAMGLVGPGDVALAMTLYILANVCFMSGDGFVSAFLCELTTRETVGKVSAIGWTMGYLGALVCLPLALLFSPGLRASPPTDAGFRIAFVFAGAWFLINMIPTTLILNERKAREKLPAGATLLGIGFTRVWESARSVGKFRDLAVYLAVFTVFSCGMTTYIAFIGVLGSQYLQGAALLGMVWVMALVSGIAAYAAGIIQDRAGHRATVTASLFVWLVTSALAVALPTANAPFVHLAAVGLGVGVGLGSTGTSARALAGSMIPESKTAEFFGLRGLAYMLAGVIGPPLYGAILASQGQRVALAMVAGFFVLGVGGMFLFDPARGRAAAEAYEKAACTAA